MITYNAARLRTYRLFTVFALLIICTCSADKRTSDVDILANVAGKDIGVKEFMHRAELTIRPGNFKDKYVTLNNIISEKILAREAEKRRDLTHNPMMLGIVKGIKEQMMRDELFKEVATNKVQMDSSKLYNAYKLSIREYKLEFYTIQKPDLAEKIKAAIDSMPSAADSMFAQVEKLLGKKNIHKIKFDDQEDDKIIESLYSNPLEVGTIVGPLKLADGSHIMMKVQSWVDYPLISGEDQQIRYKKVAENLRQRKAKQIWSTYQFNLLKDKNIKFNEKTFRILADWSMDQYIQHQQDSLRSHLQETPPPDPRVDLDAPFFSINKNVWTVEDFKNALLSHPLVFRTDNLTPENYYKQYQLAVIDMILDHYLTKEAYGLKLDDTEEIRRTAGTWKDALLATQLKRDVIKTGIQSGEIDTSITLGVTKYWESYVKTLQEKYSDSIEIDFEKFENLKMTNIDFYGYRPGVPFPAATPAFPTLILSKNLDYAKNGSVSEK